MTIDMLVSANSCFHMLLSYGNAVNDYLVNFIKFCIWILEFSNWRLLDRSCPLLSFPLELWPSYCALALVLFDAVIELNAMEGKKMFNDFLIGKGKWVV